MKNFVLVLFLGFMTGCMTANPDAISVEDRSDQLGRPIANSQGDNACKDAMNLAKQAYIRTLSTKLSADEIDESVQKQYFYGWFEPRVSTCKVYSLAHMERFGPYLSPVEALNDRLVKAEMNGEIEGFFFSKFGPYVVVYR